VGSLASLGTHDTPPLARWWRGVDIDDRGALGMLTGPQSSVERERRRAVVERVRSLTGATGPAEAVQTLTDSIASSPAAYALVNLEDLWLEDEPHNIPGTSRERPNWRRRSARSLESMRADPPTNAALRRVAKLRQESNG
jgi:4-alpha-glucanotransferase